MAYFPSLIGYVTPLQGRVGDTLDFKISSQGDAPFRARVVRIDCCDPNPAGPGMKLVPMAVDLAPTYAGQVQTVHSGSCAWGPLPALQTADAVTLELVLRPTLENDARQTVASVQDEQGIAGFALTLTQGTLACIDLATNAPCALAAGGAPLALTPRRFTRLAMTWQRGTRELVVQATPAGVRATGAGQRTTFVLPERCVPQQATTLSLAAVWRGVPAHCYNGLIETPTIRVKRASQAADAVVARWNFSGDMTSQAVPDEIDPSRVLTLVNMPMRAVRAHTWRGRTMDWKIAPDEYAAIHFHDDDLSDCGWQTSLSLTIPPVLSSAVYGLEIESEHGRDTIPFFVMPARDGHRKKILYLASTLTYQAYANHARNNFEGELAERVTQWNAYPHNPDRVPMFGASTYNRHSDGSGISISSRLRPILTMRPGYLTFFDERGSGLRHFVADSHLTDWLRTKGHDFDVITDEHLDDEGLACLQGYDVVITGSHPEYHTRRMIDAILAYRDGGGNFMYLGANGFYWKIAREQGAPFAMEIRRAEGGIRAWASEPGEYYNQFDGEYGGMWRRNGCAPQVVGGVGFAVQGKFEGSYYRRTDAARAPEIAWLFEGVDETLIGDYGLSGGGAAGFELDQLAVDLGSEESLSVVAVSENHGPSFRTVPEELLTWTVATGVDRPHGGISAHMVYGPTRGGGALFASGSITFVGSLPHNQYDNGISRLLHNCLLRFVRPSRNQ